MIWGYRDDWMEPSISIHTTHRCLQAMPRIPQAFRRLIPRWLRWLRWLRFGGRSWHRLGRQVRDLAIFHGMTNHDGDTFLMGISLWDTLWDIYVYIYIHIHMCIYIYAHVSVYIYICPCVCMYIHIYIYIYIYVYIYTYMHMCIYV